MPGPSLLSRFGISEQEASPLPGESFSEFQARMSGRGMSIPGGQNAGGLFNSLLQALMGPLGAMGRDATTGFSPMEMENRQAAALPASQASQSGAFSNIFGNGAWGGIFTGLNKKPVLGPPEPTGTAGTPGASGTPTATPATGGDPSDPLGIGEYMRSQNEQYSQGLQVQQTQFNDLLQFYQQANDKQMELAKQQQEIAKALDLAEMMGEYEGKPTLQKRLLEIQTDLAERMAQWNAAISYAQQRMSERTARIMPALNLVQQLGVASPSFVARSFAGMLPEPYMQGGAQRFSKVGAGLNIEGEL